MFVFGSATFATAQELQPVDHPEQLGFDPARLQRLTEVYQGYVDRGELPGAVLLVARADQIAYVRAIGYQDREKQIPMNVDSIFRIASMTKPIVAVAAMMLVEEGRLDLAAPVAKYLPQIGEMKVGVEQTDPATGKPVLKLEPQQTVMRIQDLMRHTSGFIYGSFGDRLVHQAYRAAGLFAAGDTLAETITKLSKLPLAHQPGEVWEYGLSFDVLGRVVEVVSGMDLDRFIAERITRPLHMPATDFYVHEADLSRVAEPQIDAATGKRPPTPDVAKRPSALSGGGGLLATAADYLRFSEMLLHGGAFGGVRLLSPHTVALMTSNALPPGVGFTELAATFVDLAPTPAMGQGFGLGMAVRTAAGHNPTPASVGTFYWTGSWGTTFWVDPQEKLIGIEMIQVPIAVSGPYRRVFRELVYQALMD